MQYIRGVSEGYFLKFTTVLRCIHHNSAIYSLHCLPQVGRVNRQMRGNRQRWPGGFGADVPEAARRAGGCAPGPGAWQQAGQGRRQSGWTGGSKGSRDPQGPTRKSAPRQKIAAARAPDGCLSARTTYCGCPAPALPFPGL